MLDAVLLSDFFLGDSVTFFSFLSDTPSEFSSGLLLVSVLKVVSSLPSLFEVLDTSSKFSSGFCVSPPEKFGILNKIIIIKSEPAITDVTFLFFHIGVFLLYTSFGVLETNVFWRSSFGEKSTKEDSK